MQANGNPMTIRKIRESEIPFLSDMLYEAIYLPEGHEPLPREVLQDKSLARYIEDWGRDEYDIALVAEMDRRLVGAIWGRRWMEGNQGYGFVDVGTPEISMAVKSGYRNKGLGTDMIMAIAAEYKKAGCKQLSLSVDKANDACRLYIRLGFKAVEETDTSWTMLYAPME